VHVRFPPVGRAGRGDGERAEIPPARPEFIVSRRKCRDFP
jgi:hypothetical protein